MAYVCDKPAGSCEKCPHYRYDEDKGRMACWAEKDGPLPSPGEKIRIIRMEGEPEYAGRTGIVKHIDDAGQIHGTWGGCALIPDTDEYEIISVSRVEEVRKIVDSLNAWINYVETLNECAYSDSILEKAYRALEKIYDEMPF
jgi:hypothetical protein